MLWHAYTWTRIHTYNNTLQFKPLFWKQILEQFTSPLSGNYGGSQGSRDCLKFFSTRELLLGAYLVYLFSRSLPCLSVFPQRLLVVSFLSANACWLLVFSPQGANPAVSLSMASSSLFPMNLVDSKAQHRIGDVFQGIHKYCPEDYVCIVDPVKSSKVTSGNIAFIVELLKNISAGLQTLEGTHGSVTHEKMKVLKN